MNDATLPDPVRPPANATEPPAPAAVAPAPVRRYRARLFQLYVLLATLAFAALAFFAHSVNYFPLDVQITLAIQSIHNGVFDVLMRYLTILGFAPQATLLSALTVLFLFTSGLKWEALAAGFSVTGASALGQLAKLVVARPRPDASIVHIFDTLSDYSFPSGHVLFYVAFAGFLWFLSYTLLKRGWRRTLALCAFGLAVALSGPSRIYAGEHWASDVAGSYLLGSVWLLLAITLYRWGKPRFFVTQPVAPEPPQDAAQHT